MTTLRILVIDDNPSDRTLVIRELQRYFEQPQIREIYSSGDLTRAIAQGEFDAVVTDFQLRWTTGIDILQLVKKRYPRCPVVMFTNTGTEEIAVEAMKIGLDDYVLKTPSRYAQVPIALATAIDRTQAKLQAELQEIRLRNLLERLKIGIFRIDSAGKLLEANSILLKLLGADSIEQAEGLLPFAKLAQSPEIQQEVELQRADGSLVKVVLSTVISQIDSTVAIDGLVEVSDC